MAYRDPFRHAPYGETERERRKRLGLPDEDAFTASSFATDDGAAAPPAPDWPSADTLIVPPTVTGAPGEPAGTGTAFPPPPVPSLAPPRVPMPAVPPPASSAPPASTPPPENQFPTGPVLPTIGSEEVYSPTGQAVSEPPPPVPQYVPPSPGMLGYPDHGQRAESLAARYVAGTLTPPTMGSEEMVYDQSQGLSPWGALPDEPYVYAPPAPVDYAKTFNDTATDWYKRYRETVTPGPGMRHLNWDEFVTRHNDALSQATQQQVEQQARYGAAVTDFNQGRLQQAAALRQANEEADRRAASQAQQWAQAVGEYQTGAQQERRTAWNEAHRNLLTMQPSGIAPTPELPGVQATGAYEPTVTNPALAPDLPGPGSGPGPGHLPNPLLVGSTYTDAAKAGLAAAHAAVTALRSEVVDNRVHPALGEAQVAFENAQAALPVLNAERAKQGHPPLPEQLFPWIVAISTLASRISLGTKDVLGNVPFNPVAEAFLPPATPGEATIGGLRGSLAQGNLGQFARAYQQRTPDLSFLPEGAVRSGLQTVGVPTSLKEAVDVAFDPVNLVLLMAGPMGRALAASESVVARQAAKVFLTTDMLARLPVELPLKAAGLGLETLGRGAGGAVAAAQALRPLALATEQTVRQIADEFGAGAFTHVAGAFGRGTADAAGALLTEPLRTAAPGARAVAEQLAPLFQQAAEDLGLGAFPHVAIQGGKASVDAVRAVTAAAVDRAAQVIDYLDTSGTPHVMDLRPNEPALGLAAPGLGETAGALIGQARDGAAYLGRALAQTPGRIVQRYAESGAPIGAPLREPPPSVTASARPRWSPEYLDQIVTFEGQPFTRGQVVAELDRRGASDQDIMRTLGKLPKRELLDEEAPGVPPVMESLAPNTGLPLGKASVPVDRTRYEQLLAEGVPQPEALERARLGPTTVTGGASAAPPAPEAPVGAAGAAPTGEVTQPGIRRRIAESPPPPTAPPVRFETARGSTYVFEQGRTVRTKSLHPGHEPTDVGVKPRSELTVFIAPTDAQEVGMWQLLEGPGTLHKRIVIAGDHVLLTQVVSPELAGNPRAGQRVVYKSFPFTREPEVGRSPLELSHPETMADGHRYFRGNHPGNPITRIEVPSEAPVTGPVPPGEPVVGAAAPAARPGPPPPESVTSSIPEPGPLERPSSPAAGASRSGAPASTRTAKTAQNPVLPEDILEARTAQRTGRLQVNDRYRETQQPLVEKGVDRFGETIWGYEYRPDVFLPSDATGMPMRYYVRLKNGALVHPDELSRIRFDRSGKLYVEGNAPIESLDRPYPEQRFLPSEEKLQVGGQVETHAENWWHLLTADERRFALAKYRAENGLPEGDLPTRGFTQLNATLKQQVVGAFHAARAEKFGTGSRAAAVTEPEPPRLGPPVEPPGAPPRPPEEPPVGPPMEPPREPPGPPAPPGGEPPPGVPGMPHYALDTAAVDRLGLQGERLPPYVADTNVLQGQARGRLLTNNEIAHAVPGPEGLTYIRTRAGETLVVRGRQVLTEAPPAQRQAAREALKAGPEPARITPEEGMQIGERHVDAALGQAHAEAVQAAMDAAARARAPEAVPGTLAPRRTLLDFPNVRATWGVDGAATDLALYRKGLSGLARELLGKIPAVGPWLEKEFPGLTLPKDVLDRLRIDSERRAQWTRDYVAQASELAAGALRRAFSLNGVYVTGLRRSEALGGALGDRVPLGDVIERQSLWQLSPEQRAAIRVYTDFAGEVTALAKAVGAKTKDLRFEAGHYFPREVLGKTIDGQLLRAVNRTNPLEERLYELMEEGIRQGINYNADFAALIRDSLAARLEQGRRASLRHALLTMENPATPGQPFAITAASRVAPELTVAAQLANREYGAARNVARLSHQLGQATEATTKALDALRTAPSAETQAAVRRAAEPLLAQATLTVNRVETVLGRLERATADRPRKIALGELRQEQGLLDHLSQTFDRLRTESGLAAEQVGRGTARLPEGLAALAERTETARTGVRTALEAGGGEPLLPVEEARLAASAATRNLKLAHEQAGRGVTETGLAAPGYQDLIALDQHTGRRLRRALGGVALDKEAFFAERALASVGEGIALVNSRVVPLRAGGDLSALFNQLSILGPRHPLVMSDALWTSVRYAGNPERIATALADRGWGEWARSWINDAGGYWAGVNAGSEYVAGPGFYRVPGVGTYYRVADHWFASVGNLARVGAYRARLLSLGIKDPAEISTRLKPQQLDAIRQTIENMAGYDAGKPAGLQKLLFFAPRYFNSNVKLIETILTNRSAGDRAYAMSALGASIGAWVMWTEAVNRANGEATDYRLLVRGPDGNPQYNSNFLRARVAGMDLSFSPRLDGLFRLLGTAALNPASGAGLLASTKGGPLLSLARDLVMGQTFQGDTLRGPVYDPQTDTERPADWWDTGRRLALITAGNLIPFVWGDWYRTLLTNPRSFVEDPDHALAQLSMNIAGAKTSDLTQSDKLDVLAQQRYGKRLEELAPKELAQLRLSPEGLAIIRGSGTDTASLKLVNLKARDFQRQAVKDAGLLAGTLDGGPYSVRQWLSELHDATVGRVGGAEVKDRLRHFEEAPPRDANEQALRGYYELQQKLQFPKSGRPPTDLGERLDDYLAALPDAQRQYVLGQLHPQATPLVDQYFTARRTAAEYLQRQADEIGEPFGVTGANVARLKRLAGEFQALGPTQQQYVKLEQPDLWQQIRLYEKFAELAKVGVATPQADAWLQANDPTLSNGQQATKFFALVPQTKLEKAEQKAQGPQPLPPGALPHAEAAPNEAESAKTGALERAASPGGGPKTLQSPLVDEVPGRMGSEEMYGDRRYTNDAGFIPRASQLPEGSDPITAVLQWAPLATKLAGRNAEDPEWLPTVLGIMALESEGQANAQGDPYPGQRDRFHAYGLFQLHDEGMGAGMSVEERKDPETNMRTAFAAINPAFEAGRARGLTGPALTQYVYQHSINPGSTAESWQVGGVRQNAALVARALAGESGPVSPVRTALAGTVPGEGVGPPVGVGPDGSWQGAPPTQTPEERLARVRAERAADADQQMQTGNLWVGRTDQEQRALPAAGETFVSPPVMGSEEMYGDRTQGRPVEPGAAELEPSAPDFERRAPIEGETLPQGGEVPSRQLTTDAQGRRGYFDEDSGRFVPVDEPVASVSPSPRLPVSPSPSEVDTGEGLLTSVPPEDQLDENGQRLPGTPAASEAPAAPAPTPGTSPAPAPAPTEREHRFDKLFAYQFANKRTASDILDEIVTQSGKVRNAKDAVDRQQAEAALAWLQERLGQAPQPRTQTLPDYDREVAKLRAAAQRATDSDAPAVARTLTQLADDMAAKAPLEQLSPDEQTKRRAANEHKLAKLDPDDPRALALRAENDRLTAALARGGTIPSHENTVPGLQQELTSTQARYDYLRSLPRNGQDRTPNDPESPEEQALRQKLTTLRAELNVKQQQEQERQQPELKAARTQQLLKDAQQILLGGTGGSVTGDDDRFMQWIMDEAQHNPELKQGLDKLRTEARRKLLAEQPEATRVSPMTAALAIRDSEPAGSQARARADWLIQQGRYAEVLPGGEADLTPVLKKDEVAPTEAGLKQVATASFDHAMQQYAIEQHPTSAVAQAAFVARAQAALQDAQTGHPGEKLGDTPKHEQLKPPKGEKVASLDQLHDRGSVGGTAASFANSLYYRWGEQGDSLAERSADFVGAVYRQERGSIGRRPETILALSKPEGTPAAGDVVVQRNADGSVARLGVYDGQGGMYTVGPDGAAGRVAIDPASVEFRAVAKGTTAQQGTPKDTWQPPTHEQAVAGPKQAVALPASGKTTAIPGGPTLTPADQKTASQVSGGTGGNVERWAPTVAKFAGNLANDPAFMQIALATIRAESGGNPAAQGDQGHSVGLFQLHDQGMGTGLSVAQRADPDTNAGLAVPALAKAYAAGQAQGLSGADLAWYTYQHAINPGAVAGQQEHANFMGAYAGTATGASTPTLTPVAQGDANNYDKDGQYTYSTWHSSACSAATILANLRARGYQGNLSDVIKVMAEHGLINPTQGLAQRSDGIGKAAALFGLPVEKVAVDHDTFRQATPANPIIIDVKDIRPDFGGGHYLNVVGADDTGLSVVDSSGYGLQRLSWDEYERGKYDNTGWQVQNPQHFEGGAHVPDPDEVAKYPGAPGTVAGIAAGEPTQLVGPGSPTPGAGPGPGGTAGRTSGIPAPDGPRGPVKGEVPPTVPSGSGGGGRGRGGGGYAHPQPAVPPPPHMPEIRLPSGGERGGLAASMVGSLLKGATVPPPANPYAIRIETPNVLGSPPPPLPSLTRRALGDFPNFARVEQGDAGHLTPAQRDRGVDTFLHVNAMPATDPLDLFRREVAKRTLPAYRVGAAVQATHRRQQG